MMYLLKRIVLVALLGCAVQQMSAASMYENQNQQVQQKKEDSDVMAPGRILWLKFFIIISANPMLWACYKDAEVRHYAGITAALWTVFLVQALLDELKCLATK